jgi:hypothetical protein
LLNLVYHASLPTSSRLVLKNKTNTANIQSLLRTICLFIVETIMLFYTYVWRLSASSIFVWLFVYYNARSLFVRKHFINFIFTLLNQQGICFLFILSVFLLIFLYRIISLKMHVYKCYPKLLLYISVIFLSTVSLMV